MGDLDLRMTEETSSLSELRGDINTLSKLWVRLGGSLTALRQVLMAIEMSGLENKLDRANPGCVTLIRETLEEAGYPVRKADYEG